MTHIFNPMSTIVTPCPSFESILNDKLVTWPLRWGLIIHSWGRMVTLPRRLVNNGSRVVGNQLADGSKGGMSRLRSQFSRPLLKRNHVISRESGCKFITNSTHAILEKAISRSFCGGFAALGLKLLPEWTSFHQLTENWFWFPWFHHTITLNRADNGARWNRNPSQYRPWIRKKLDWMGSGDSKCSYWWFN